MAKSIIPDIVHTLARIADALERLAPPSPQALGLADCDAYVWQSEAQSLAPVLAVNRVDLTLLQGVERVRDILLANTQQFADGFAANNALLWGARGMGKSSLVKAVHAEVNAGHQPDTCLVLIEIHREDVPTLPALLARLRLSERRFLLFCDDLSFDHDDTSYKSLKAVLDGGIEGRPANVILYATSNRRHLLPRDMIDNERSSAVNPGESNEEKISLSDRFGLWLGFHACDQATYLAMICGYASRYGLTLDDATLVQQAAEWAMTRGGRSGRVAWQFIQDLAGRQRVSIAD